MRNHRLTVISLFVAIVMVGGCSDSPDTPSGGMAGATAGPTTESTATAARHAVANAYVDAVARGVANVDGAARNAVISCFSVFDPNTPTEASWRQCAGNVVAVDVALSAFDRDIGGTGDLSGSHSGAPGCLARADASLTSALLKYRGAVEDAENPPNPLDERLVVVVGDLGYDRKGTPMANGGIQPVNDAAREIVQSNCWKG